MPSKGRGGQDDRSESRSKKPKKSQSLPALTPAPRSPLDIPQQLCTVEVRKRSVVRSTVSAGSIKQLPQSRLRFTTSERGLEWERSHVMTQLPSHKLPPLHDVMRMAVKEFNIQLPSKKKESGKRKEQGRQSKSEAVIYSPYLGGPRLPMRGRVIDVISPRSPVNVEVTAPAEERLSTAIEETSEGKAQIDVPPSSGGGAPGEAIAASPDPQVTVDVASQPAPKPADTFTIDDLPFPWDEDEMRSAFSRFDSDRDGELHVEELPTMLRFLGARPQAGDCEQIVREQTRFSTLSWEEVVDFLYRFRRLDVTRMRDVFMAADEDGSGELDFNELHALLHQMGYYPTTQSTLEAFEALDKDKSSTIAFPEFEGLREHLRVTEGFTKADFAEIELLYSKSCLGKAGPQEVVEETWRITMYLGYSASIDSIASCCDQVNPDRSNGIVCVELLKIVRLVRETEIADMIKTMRAYGDDPHHLPCEDLGLALTDLGYFVSEDAVNEILESLGECEREESLTLEEFGAFLRAYRRIEGFTEEELQELQEVFSQEGRLEAGALHTLEVGKVLRWFGFSRSVQEVTRLVEEIDLDGSGVLEFPEFTKLMRRLHQEEAEHRQQFFFELATYSAKNALEMHLSAMGEAVTLLAGAEPDPLIVENASKALIAEMYGPAHQGAESAGEDKPQSIFVGRQGYEAWFRHFRRLLMEDIRASAGYNIAEKAWLQQLFNGYDEDGSGTIERGELMQLIASYFPDSTKSKDGQRDVQKALDEVDTEGKGELDFKAFLRLTRKCDDSRDSRDMQLEVEVVKECDFTPEEVDGFRQIFSANVDWKGELDLQSLASILSRVAKLSEDDLRNLSSLVCDVHPQGREVARFPQFLKLVKRLTEENYGKLNDQAERFLKRQQEQQHMLQTARRLTQMAA